MTDVGVGVSGEDKGEDKGVAASPPGCQPTASAAVPASSRSGIPNAERSKWRTIHLKVSREFHDRIGKSAKRHGRTMSQEILARLERVYLPENNDGMAAD
jgi:hypothetical protein